VGITPPFWTRIRGVLAAILGMVSACLDKNPECCCAAISFTFDRWFGPLIEVIFGCCYD